MGDKRGVWTAVFRLWQVVGDAIATTAELLEYAIERQNVQT
jgi:hypothetical protein